jgi:hypothetical protein
MILAGVVLLAAGMATVLFGGLSAEVSRLFRPAETGRGAAAPALRVLLTVDPAHPGAHFALGAIGLSLEADELETKDLSADHRSLVALMRRLGPAVLRLGGNSLDYSWWDNGGERPPNWAKSVVTPADLDRLRGLLEATGWRVILGVDLGHFDPGRAASEARVAESILGSRLLGFEVGNEPNDYGGALVKLRPTSYTASEYLKELAAYDAAMRTNVPQLQLYGPDLGAQSLEEWALTIASVKDMPFAAITEHYYPTVYNVARGTCKGTAIPSALELLSSQVREREDAMLRSLTKIGEIARRETLISETNTTASCDAGGGPATSPVFASALWAFDWVLRAAEAGVAGLYFHGDLRGCLLEGVSPICMHNTSASRVEAIARPEYYGLLAARELEGGFFIPVHTDSSDQPARTFTAYATIHPKAITVAIDNLATTGTRTFMLRASGYRRATAESLTARSISAVKGVTFGRASFDAMGTLRAKSKGVPKVGGDFRIALTPSSATVVSLYR